MNSRTCGYYICLIPTIYYPASGVYYSYGSYCNDSRNHFGWSRIKDLRLSWLCRTSKSELAWRKPRVLLGKSLAQHGHFSLVEFDMDGSIMFRTGQGQGGEAEPLNNSSKTYGIIWKRSMVRSSWKKTWPSEFWQASVQIGRNTLQGNSWQSNLGDQTVTSQE